MHQSTPIHILFRVSGGVILILTSILSLLCQISSWWKLCPSIITSQPRSKSGSRVLRKSTNMAHQKRIAWGRWHIGLKACSRSQERNTVLHDTGRDDATFHLGDARRWVQPHRGRTINSHKKKNVERWLLAGNRSHQGANTENFTNVSSLCSWLQRIPLSCTVLPPHNMISRL